jgi:predicted ArsR family transcriptional regulator
MSNKSFINSPDPPRSPADRLLFLLKTRGPQSAQALASTVGVTKEAARQHLLRLAEEGLVLATSEIRGVGRPVQVWELTVAAQKRFPDSHAELAAGMIESVRALFGTDGLEALIARREQESRERYRACLRGAVKLQQKVARLAKQRAGEGYMAEWHREGDEFVLVENHCPICAVATACSGFCRSELQLFRELLGPEVTVERTDHLLAGARRCAYRITPQRTA